MNNLKDGKMNISYVANVCPSIDSHHDERTLICENIARRLFSETFKRFQSIGTSEFQYSYKAREKLRKEVLTPLRRLNRQIEYEQTGVKHGGITLRSNGFGSENVKLPDLFVKCLTGNQKHRLRWSSQWNVLINSYKKRMT
eukprot:UN31950